MGALRTWTAVGRPTHELSPDFLLNSSVLLFHFLDLVALRRRREFVALAGVDLQFAFDLFADVVVGEAVLEARQDGPSYFLGPDSKHHARA
jgi:hypothetical protein